MRHSLALGYCVLALAQVTISVNVVTSKVLLESMPMFVLLAGRFGLCSLLLGIILFLSRTSLACPTHPEGKLTPNDWWLAILSGLSAAFLFNFFFGWGLKHTTATAAGIVGSTLPAIVALLAVWLLKEKLSTMKLFALILAIAGVLVINLEDPKGIANNAHTYFGDFLIFLAMIPEAWYSILSRKLAGRVTPLGAAFIATAVGFLALLPFAVFTSNAALNLAGYSFLELLLLSVSAMSSLLFFCAWGWALSFIPASTAGIFGGVMPVATSVFAIFFLKETFHWNDGIGMLLVFASIVLGAGLKFRKTPLPVQNS